MEAQSSRRPIDKQREIGLKKPRLEETAERRAPPRAAGTGSNAFLARFRTNERERDGSRGRIAVDEVKEREEPGKRAYHQQQELLSQYKTALGELTFNSKPIITNLTIIAGENTHAAKGIAATICANILEVPNEQKLPSLYLLDSIVKNIGGDYVKYFATRLPEVFSEAYRKVDPSTHPSMQHLFRTWRSVFPSPTLRIIEQQLNFPPSTNSSSSGGASTSKTDPQTQRPAHGIHVNPKYFEARQHLQQSNRNRSKGSETENSRSILKEDKVGPAQTSVSGGPKRWAEVSAKMVGDDKLIESVYDKRPGSGYLDYEIISDPPNHQKVANKWSGERTTEGSEGTDDAWHRGTDGNKANTLLGRKNSYDMAHLSSLGLVDSYGNQRASRSGGNLPQLDPVPNSASLSSRNTLRNWKNSDEEEFVWDDMNSRVTDIIEADGLKKDGRNHDYSAKSLGERMRKWMPADSEQLARRWSEGGLLSRSEQPVPGNDKFPAQMELDDQESLGWKEAHPLDKKGMSIDSSSAGQEVEPRFGHQTSRIPLNQLNPSRSISRLRPSDTLKRPTNDSIGTDQVEGFSVTLAGSSNANVSQPSSLAKVGVGVQIGPIATSTFGSLQHVAPGFSGTPAQQQNWKPLSPSGHALHQRSHSPSSSSPHQLAYRVQPQNLPEQEHPEVMSFPIGQNAMPGGLAKASPEIQGNQKLQGQASNQFNSRFSVHSQPLQQFDNISFIPAQQRTHLSFLQAEPSQPPGLSKQAQTQPQDFGFQTITPTSLKNSSAGLSGHTSTSSLLATIVNNGLLSLNSAASGDVTKSTSSFSDVSHSELIHSQSRIRTLPPLPTGPPPMQISTSSQGPDQESALSALSHSLLGTSQPPLPPGPPPPSSVVGTSSQSSGNVLTNPLSNLLSSLVAKGLISTSAPETSKVNPTLVPIQTQNQNDGAVASNSILGSSKPNLLMTSPLTPPDGDLSISESSSLPSGHPNASAENRECIGVEFKPEVIREFHASVINGLFDDLPCQCSICGFRLEDEDSLSKHLSWHDSLKLEVNNTKRMSRKWYASLREWVEGEVGPSSNAMDDVLAHGSTLCAESSEPMVSADESQCICALCGEPFEDFYCHKRDEWMFKGAVFMSMSTNGAGTVDPDFSPKQIVHVNCSSKRSGGGLED